MSIRLIAWSVLAVIPLAATAACSAGQESSSEKGTTPAVFTSSPPPCPGGVVADDGLGPTGQQPCAKEHHAGTVVELGKPTEVEVTADSLAGSPSHSGVMGIYAPRSWGAGAEGLACTVTDPSNQPVAVNLPNPGIVQPQDLDGQPWVTVLTYTATAGKSKVDCHDDGSGRLPMHQGTLSVRVIPLEVGGF